MQNEQNLVNRLAENAKNTGVTQELFDSVCKVAYKRFKQLGVPQGEIMSLACLAIDSALKGWNEGDFALSVWSKAGYEAQKFHRSTSVVKQPVPSVLKYKENEGEDVSISVTYVSDHETDDDVFFGSVEAAEYDADEWQLLRDAVATLSEPDRELYERHIVNEETLDIIANDLKISRQAVHTRVKKLTKKLQYEIFLRKL